MQPSLRQFDARRVRHADVLEWLWFLNSHRKPVFDWMWGDKDTYRLAFALAGKADSFQLVCFQTSHGPHALCLCLVPFGCALLLMLMLLLMRVASLTPLLPLHLSAYSVSNEVGQTMCPRR